LMANALADSATASVSANLRIHCLLGENPWKRFRFTFPKVILVAEHGT
jgi:hypothetical protein